ncbi:hypothetical protein N7499_000047 [Penicillium canescens]|nr:hypothetical protein N7522_005623 [Penicillium canescens]KAJ6100417.1 hypothetical protein N7499_000047 [Penicillium canescens]KAJ6172880.1 hypothetical protein N7485_005692 [Penicillium canescens]
MKQFARLLDFYLSENKDHWAEIQKIAHHDTPEAFEKPPVNIENATVVDGERQIPVKKGDTIFADFVTANVDPKAFPDPLEIKLDRPDSSYIHQGYGGDTCLGPAGQLKATTVNGAFQVYMNEDWSEWTPFPANMKVQFDGF